MADTATSLPGQTTPSSTQPRSIKSTGRRMTRRSAVQVYRGQDIGQGPGLLAGLCARPTDLVTIRAPKSPADDHP